VTGSRSTVAVLGATGHVGQVLAHGLPQDRLDLVLVVRDSERGRKVAGSAGLDPGRVVTFDALGATEADALVNCVGLGDPAAVAARPEEVYAVTQRLDEICLAYLESRPGTVLVNMSSGAVYGTDFSGPARDDSVLTVPVNAVGPEDHYGIAKAASEARHRAAAAASIVDLRLFGLFSRYIDPGARYFANELVRCARTGEEFVTGPDDMKRDFVHPDDLAALVGLALGSRGVNTAWDVATGAPVSKSELIAAFETRFGMRSRIDDTLLPPSATGAKTDYYSLSRRAQAEAGWEPRYTSLEAVLAEATAVLEQEGAGS
jgi:nucleoside-diphosphate-sugar epimerase